MDLLVNSIKDLGINNTNPSQTLPENGEGGNNSPWFYEASAPLRVLFKPGLNRTQDHRSQLVLVPLGFQQILKASWEARNVI